MARKPTAGATPKSSSKRATRKPAKKTTTKIEAASATPAAEPPKQPDAPKQERPAEHYIHEQYSPAQIIEALAMSAGIVAAAARILKCGRSTIHRYVEKYPEITAALKEIEEDRIDIAEIGLVNFLEDKEHPTLRLKAIEFYLRTKGKARGYNMATEVVGKNGGAIETKATLALDLSGFSPEELAALEQTALLTVKAAAAAA